MQILPNDPMPHDPDLLNELGRVVWAAARLHAYIRDAINRLDGAASDGPFDATLGQAVRDLEAKAAGRNTDLAHWVCTIGDPVTKRRNSVLHAITYTATDGKQALRSSRDPQSQRFTPESLRAVSNALVEAARSLENAEARSGLIQRESREESGHDER